MGIPPRWKAIAKTTLTILVATITAFGALATIFTNFGVTFEKLGPYVIPTGHPLALGAFFIGDLAVFGYVMYRIGSARLTKRAALLESRVACRLDSDMGDFREVSERSAVASFARSSSNFAMRVRRAFIDSWSSCRRSSTGP